MASTNSDDVSFTETESVTFGGILFDMDGTIIDSKDAIVKFWHE